MAKGAENPVGKFRENLDKADGNQDQKFNGFELDKENADLVRRLGYMLKRPEEAKAVFDAIEATAKQLKLKKMDICKALELPPIEQVTFPFDPQKMYRVQYPVGGSRAKLPAYVQTTASGEFIIKDRVHTRLDLDHKAGKTYDLPDKAIGEWKVRKHPKSGQKLNDDDQFNILREYFCNKTVYSIGGEVVEPVLVSPAVARLGSRQGSSNPWDETQANEASRKAKRSEEELDAKRHEREELERKEKERREKSTHKFR